MDTEPCWVCHQPCTTGECETCYQTPDEDIVIKPESEDSDDDRQDTDQ